MDIHRITVSKIVFDLVILLCLLAIPQVFLPLFETYKRGFFCDDESLMHPYHHSLIKEYLLYIIVILIPLCIILLMEYLHGRNRSVESAPEYKFLDKKVPSWIVESYKQLGIFAFGFASQQLVVDIGKKLVGRLRPHFFNVCQPIMSDDTNCNNPINIGRYIEDFTCEAEDSTPFMLEQMRLSFPSGHSSWSAFSMVYCIIYLQSRINWRGSKLLKHFIQLFLFLTAWFTALSRISNYKHHWSDVLAGGAIGIFFAIIVSQCVADFNQKTNLELPRTQNDLTTNHLQFINYQKQNHQNSSNGHNNNISKKTVNTKIIRINQKQQTPSLQNLK